MLASRRAPPAVGRRDVDAEEAVAAVAAGLRVLERASSPARTASVMPPRTPSCTYVFHGRPIETKPRPPSPKRDCSWRRKAAVPISLAVCESPNCRMRTSSWPRPSSRRGEALEEMSEVVGRRRGDRPKRRRAASRSATGRSRRPRRDRVAGAPGSEEAPTVAIRALRSRWGANAMSGGRPVDLRGRALAARRAAARAERRARDRTADRTADRIVAWRSEATQIGAR